MQKVPRPQDRFPDLWLSVNRFLAWLEVQGYESYDPYDLWGTRYGVFSRGFYYRHAELGLPLIAPILLLEVLCPQARALFVRKRRYATGDAQLVLAFLNLYELTGEQKFVEKATDLARDLLACSVPGYRGYCWGYPFDWQHNRGMWQENVPFITVTPYCFEAFVALFDALGDKKFLEVAASIATFVHRDLRDTPTSSDASAGSYSPVDDSQVINTSAYRAMVLFEAAWRFSNSDYQRTAQRNLNFILQNQREDGAWLYAPDHGPDRFIDHFHTCFVLKNLFKLNRRLQSEAVSQAIANGYRYYREKLFDNNFPKLFSEEPRTGIVKLEMYDLAEAITLGTLLRQSLPPAFDLACELARRTCAEYQLPSGHFVTRVYRAGGWRHTSPFLRWPQAQILYALTNVLKAQSEPAAEFASARQSRPVLS